MLFRATSEPGDDDGGQDEGTELGLRWPLSFPHCARLGAVAFWVSEESGLLSGMSCRGAGLVGGQGIHHKEPPCTEQVMRVWRSLRGHLLNPRSSERLIRGSPFSPGS